MHIWQPFMCLESAEKSTDVVLLFEMLQSPSISVSPFDVLAANITNSSQRLQQDMKPANTQTHPAVGGTVQVLKMPALRGEMFGYHSVYLLILFCEYIQVACPSEIMIPGE